MEWDKAIERNKLALVHIISALFTLLVHLPGVPVHSSPTKFCVASGSQFQAWVAVTQQGQTGTLGDLHVRQWHPRKYSSQRRHVENVQPAARVAVSEDEVTRNTVQELTSRIGPTQ